MLFSFTYITGTSVQVHKFASHSNRHETMTSAALVFGCSLIAFSPTASLLLILAYRKAQLVIVVTISAFAFLLSSLLASTLWIVFPNSIKSSPLLLIPIGVASQCLFRILFVKGYFKIEKVIHDSVQRHMETSTSEENIAESAKLRLELNDWACGLASGVGFGGMHALMLYGTLLSSEMDNLGTLYQPSCPAIPSLVLSAINAFLFSILDIVVMLLSFYGLRIRSRIQTSLYFPDEINPRKSEFILVLSIFFHLVAACVTVFNSSENGCLLSLPLLSLIVMGCTFFFAKYILPYYHNPRRDHMGHSD